MKSMSAERRRDLHRQAGRHAAFCLWASVPLFFVHFVLTCLDTNWDPSLYGDVMVQSPVLFKLLLGGHWILRMVLFVAFGWEIFRGKLGLMVLTAGGAVLEAILFQRLGPSSLNGLWDAGVWTVTFLWTLTVVLIREPFRRKRNRILQLSLIGGAVILFDLTYLGRYGQMVGNEWYLILSWLLQDGLRISATLLLFLWLMTVELPSPEPEEPEAPAEPDPA